MNSMALQLPSNYAECERNEMDYIDGGISLSKKWYGFSIWFNEHDTQGLLVAIGIGSAASWLAAELLAAGIVTLPGAVPFGIVAAALATSGSVIAGLAWKNNGGFSANFTNTGQLLGIW